MEVKYYFRIIIVNLFNCEIFHFLVYFLLTYALMSLYGMFRAKFHSEWSINKALSGNTFFWIHTFIIDSFKEK